MFDRMSNMGNLFLGHTYTHTHTHTDHLWWQEGQQVKLWRGGPEQHNTPITSQIRIRKQVVLFDGVIQADRGQRGFFMDTLSGVTVQGNQKWFFFLVKVAVIKYKDVKVQVKVVKRLLFSIRSSATSDTLDYHHVEAKLTSDFISSVL